MGTSNTSESARRLSKYSAFEDDDKTMMSCLSATYFPMNFNGKEVIMAGIGDVSSMPAYRRHGGIRACFSKMLQDSYAAGVAFSYLYPFSTCFYNKFGYGMIINGPLEYQFITKANPCKSQEFVYLYQSVNGIPKGYISFHKEDNEGGRILTCTKIVFVDSEGLMGLLELAASYAADYKNIRFTVPEDAEVEAALKEFSFGACRVDLSYTGMVRVINVEESLRLSSYREKGSIAIRVTDPYIESNNRIFTVTYQNGKAIKDT